jgi:4-hydroxybenzoate polyprenyltransferase
LLAGAIFLYDAIHKKTVLSPVLMAACRWLLFLMAAATGIDGINGLSLWSAFALGAYIIGLSYVAKFESVPGVLRYWPLIFLAAPVALAYFANAGEYKARSLALSALLLVWIGMCLRFTFRGERRNFGRTVSGLLAGIALVDLLAICGEPTAVAVAFPVLFILALIFQRFIPAT